METRIRPTHLDNKKSAVLFVSSLAALGLCSFQFGDNSGLNNMPFTQVQSLVSDLTRAKKMAKEGNIDLFAGQELSGQTVHLRGELTDANCYLATHTHAYDHAFCAKLCVASGAPLIFISDQGGQVYLVLSERNAVRLPENVLDHIGVPGILINGKVIEAGALHALAVEGLVQ